MKYAILFKIKFYRKIGFKKHNYHKQIHFWISSEMCKFSHIYYDQMIKKNIFDSIDNTSHNIIINS